LLGFAKQPVAMRPEGQRENEHVGAEEHRISKENKLSGVFPHLFLAGVVL